MNNSTTKKNIALAGHAGSGKTTLCEALLYRNSAIERMGKIAEENTVSDYTAEEMKRKSSVYTSVASMSLQKLDVNAIQRTLKYRHKQDNLRFLHLISQTLQSHYVKRNLA